MRNIILLALGEMQLIQIFISFSDVLILVDDKCTKLAAIWDNMRENSIRIGRK